MASMDESLRLKESDPVCRLPLDDGRRQRMRSVCGCQPDAIDSVFSGGWVISTGDGC